MSNAREILIYIYIYAYAYTHVNVYTHVPTVCMCNCSMHPLNSVSGELPAFFGDLESNARVSIMSRLNLASQARMIAMM